MTTEDLNRIEAELQLHLPADYRRLLLAYPPFLLDAYYNSPVGGRAADALLFAVPQRVIDYNRGWRDDDFLLGENDPEPRPDRYLVIGEDCAGNRWCVKLGTDDPTVWFFNHEDGSLERSAATCAEYVEDTRRHLLELGDGQMQSWQEVRDKEDAEWAQRAATASPAEISRRLYLERCRAQLGY